MKIKGIYHKPIADQVNPKNIAEGLLSVPQILKEVQAVQNDIVKVVDAELQKIDDKISEVEQHTKDSEQKVDEKLSTFEATVNYIKQIPTIKGDKGQDADQVDTEKLKSEILAQIPAPDEKSIAKRAALLVPESKPSLKVIRETISSDPMAIIDAILSLPEGKFKLKTSNIEGLDQTIRAFNAQMGNRGYIHGGGDTVVAGTNITITTNANGTKTINSSGGGGVGPGTINQIAYFNTTTTVASLTTATYPNLTELSYVKGVTSAIQTQLNSKGAGTVTSVSSANGDLTVATGTTTPVLTINSAPILTTARTIGGVSFNGSANITVATATGGFAVTGGNLSVDGTLRILEGGGTPTKYTIFQGGDQAIDLTYTLPTAYPAVTGYVLSSTDAGVMSWVAQSGGGGSPGGSDTQVQFNDSSAFGGDAGFTYNKTTNIVTLGGLVTSDIHTVDANTATSISILAGSALSGNTLGGSIELTSGAGFGTQAGGSFLLAGGDAGATGNGGNISLTAGAGGATSGNGGSATISGAQAQTLGNGGQVTLSGADGFGASKIGGDINLALGSGDMGGRNGEVFIYNNNAGISAILNIDSLASSDKTFTFPNQSGTFALQGLAGTKIYYVSDSSGGAVNRKLTFTNGILTAET